MFVVLFEVEPRAERFEEYLSIAGALRPELERIPGFIENVRWRSLRRPGWLLSVSTWRDEAALIAWRSHAGHHIAQQRGRGGIFRDYRLRVGVAAAEGTVTVTESDNPGGDAADVARGLGLDEAASSGPLGWDVFEALLTQGRFLLLQSWQASGNGPGGAPAAAGPAPADARRMAVRILRDYGMHARAQAPQAFPPVPDEGGPPA